MLKWLCPINRGTSPIYEEWPATRNEQSPFLESSLMGKSRMRVTLGFAGIVDSCFCCWKDIYTHRHNFPVFLSFCWCQIMLHPCWLFVKPSFLLVFHTMYCWVQPQFLVIKTPTVIGPFVFDKNWVALSGSCWGRWCRASLHSTWSALPGTVHGSWNLPAAGPSCHRPGTSWGCPVTPGDEDFGVKIGEKTGKNMTFPCSSRCLGSDLPQVLVSSGTICKVDQRAQTFGHLNVAIVS